MLLKGDSTSEELRSRNEIEHIIGGEDRQIALVWSYREKEQVGVC